MKQFFLGLLRTLIGPNIGALAAVLAYFAFSSMIPVLLLLVFVTSRIIPAQDVERAVIDLLHAYVPALPNEMGVVTETVRRLAGVGPEVGVLGLLGTLWNTIGGFMSLQWILDQLWGIQHRRAFLRQYLVGFVMLFVLILLTVVSALAAETARLAATARLSPLLTADFVRLAPVTHIAVSAAFPLLLFITCLVVYSLLPSHVSPLFDRAVGAATATAGIFVTRVLFLLYTHHLRHYEAMYGALSFLMLLTFWIYIASMLLLFGAAVTVNLERVRGGARETNTSG